MGPPGTSGAKIIDPNGPAYYAYPARVSFPGGGVDANAL